MAIIISGISRISSQGKPMRQFRKAINKQLNSPNFLSIAAWTFLSCLLLPMSGCDDPIPGPIGGLVLVIRSFEATKDADIQAISRIEIQTQRIEVMHANMIGGGESSVVVDTQSRTLLIANRGMTDR